MRSLEMIVTFNALLVPLTLVVIVSAEPRFINFPIVVKKTNVATCLPLGSKCMMSKLPCCGLKYANSYLRLGNVPTTCFKFGEGICQVNQSIKNIDEYSMLIKQLNGTNFQQLKKKYWDSASTVYTCPQKITIEMKSG